MAWTSGQFRSLFGQFQTFSHVTKCSQTHCKKRLLQIVKKIKVNTYYVGIWKVLNVLLFKTVYLLVVVTSVPFYQIKLISHLVVYDRNQVSVLETETKVQFLYWYQSRNYFFPKPTYFFIFLSKYFKFLSFFPISWWI